MNDTIAAGTALTMVSGGPTHDHDWRGDTAYGKFVLGFDYDKTSGTASTMKAAAASCKNKDPDGGREMDGNRIANNGDDRDWSY